jgi:hypothetical protein
MDYLVRKVARRKWELQEDQSGDFVAADAITACLRTTDNTLSTWECDGTEAGIDKAVLALAAAADRIDKLDVLILSKAEVEALDITLARTPQPDNPAVELQSTHVDLVGIEVQRLADLSRLMAKGIRELGKCRLYSKKRVETLLREAFASKKLDSELIQVRLLTQLVQESQRVSVVSVRMTLDETTSATARSFIEPELNRRLLPDTGEVWHRVEADLPHYRIEKVEQEPRSRRAWSSA